MDDIRTEMQRVHALRAIVCAFAELKWLAAARRVEIAIERYALALHLDAKAGFKPDQPRVPKGSPGGGQWSGGTGSQEPTVGEVDGEQSPKPEDPDGKPPTSRGRPPFLRKQRDARCILAQQSRHSRA